MPATGANLNMQFDPLPLPDNTPVKSENDRQSQKLQQTAAVPRGAGYMPKAGGIAYIANNLLQGWMAGRHIQAERKLSKAKDDVLQSKSIYDTLAGVYSQNIASGKSKDDPEMQKMAKDITAAWGNYVNTADKYTSPPEDAGKGGKKKSLGARVGGGAKKALMTNTDPELYRSASVNILRQSGPPVLHEQATPEQRVAAAGADDQIQNIKDRKRWGELAQLDPSKLTKDQQTELDGLERKLFPKTTEQSVKDTLLKKVMAGEKIPDSQRDLAENLGILKPGVTNTLQWKDDNGHDWLVAVDKNGQEVGRRDLGKGYIPPDQASVAQRILDAQIEGMVREYKKSFPDATDRDAHRFALMTVAGYKGLGGSPMEAERKQFILDKAIKAVVGEDKDKKAIYGNFIVAPGDDPNGLYFYRTNIVDPQQPEVTHWFWANDPAKYYGGITKDQLPGQERDFRTRLRVALKKQNPKLSDDDINSIMPPQIFSETVAPKSAQNTEQNKPSVTSDRNLDATPNSDRNLDPTPKHISATDLQTFAAQHNVPYDDAKRQFESAGYTITGTR